ncbi:family 16 glycosylhydrolase [Treponema zuelzerae]|uniref:Family 16 glycosylhydrolase n=1 Tax=Teretinema zuelzerae TaxID=156 RepID=A0AAE3JIM8_9SPIR|nr:family 16 glycosylhydrolase [Teretinema zuelzerae]MCD1654356.1 family 16 glycosylhydrolase [Teretinema zuelzerae]
MKRLHVLAASLMLLAAAASLGAQDKGTLAPDQIPGVAAYIAYPVSIKADGKLDDWKGIPVQKVSRAIYAGPDITQSPWFEFAVAGDAKNLYVLMRTKDSKIIAGKHGADYWNEDSMEFYVNFTGNLLAKSYTAGIMQITINATNIGKKAGTPLSITGMNNAKAGVTGTAFKTADGWAFEAVLPYPAGFTPSHGKIIGFQAHTNGASELDRDTKLIWSAADEADNSYQNPSLFGQGIFFNVGKNDIPQPSSQVFDLGAEFKKNGASGKTNRKIVWADEFKSGKAPDPAKWAYDAPDSGKWNQELQEYTDSRENSYVENDLLTISARKGADGKWKSARLYTKGKADWTYGYFEVRAKLPAGKGTWPAIWMMPAKDSYGDWPASGEIDIMEFVGFEPDRIHTSVHTTSYNHRLGTQKTRAAPVKGVTDGFHDYAVEWTPKGIFWYIDNKPFYSFMKEDGGSTVWPFDKPFFLILNVAMGGSWGGMKGMDPALDKADMVIDYVRVYQ